MDFYKLLKSLEELLYEVMVLLVFFPRTLWLSLRYPQRMMDYADTELGDVQSGQYNDTVSPPLFLMIALGISYFASLVFDGEVRADERPPLLADPERLMFFRVFVFSLLPLFFSLRLLKDLGIKLDRDSLRAPFFSQCFVTAPFALVFGVGLAMATGTYPSARLPGTAIVVMACFWYVRQQAHWFATKRQTGHLRGWSTALTTFFLGWAVIVAMVLAIGKMT